jgi:prepilin-type N-terminal cleavage/methylation domain-containing protein
MNRYWLVGHHRRYSASGYTLLEILIVLVILGILSAIVAPGWLGFVQQRQLKTAQEQLQRASHEAISNAKKNKLVWQVSFRKGTLQSQYAVHQALTLPEHIQWQDLGEHVKIDEDNTTFYQDKNNIWRVQYNHQGNTNGRLGRITLMASSGGAARYCVITNTLIGNTKLASDKDCIK